MLAIVLDNHQIDGVIGIILLLFLVTLAIGLAKAIAKIVTYSGTAAGVGIVGLFVMFFGKAINLFFKVIQTILRLIYQYIILGFIPWVFCGLWTLIKKVFSKNSDSVPTYGN